VGLDRHKLLWDGTDKYVPWTTLTIVTRDVGYACLLVIYSFVTRQVIIGQDAHIFILLHDSYQRPNCANTVLTRHESRARLGIYPTGVEKYKTCASFEMAARQSTSIWSYWKNQLQILILSNGKIKLKTAFGRWSHITLGRVLIGFVRGVHSFRPNRQKGPWH